MKWLTLFLTFTFTALVMGAGIAQAQTVPVGAGSYTTTLPPGGSNPSNELGNPVFPIRTGQISGPIPTSDWCTGVVYKYRPDNFHTDVLAAHPLVLKSYAHGLGLGTARLNTPAGLQPIEYQYPYAEDLVVGLEDLNSTFTMLDGYSDWTVTAKWESGGNALTATFGHGLPFVYFQKTSGTFRIELTPEATIWHNENGVLGVTIADRQYGIFAPTGSAWTIADSVLTSDLNGLDYCSIATLPDDDAATFNFFRNHAYAFVIDTQVNWDYDESTSVLTTTYEVTTDVKEGSESTTLLALYRHQWQHRDAALTDFSYPSPRGVMKLMNGNSFSTVLTYPGLIPEFPNILTDEFGYDQAQMNSFLDEFLNQSYAELFPHIDTYFGGKDMGRVAAVIRIADQVNRPDVRDYLLTGLKAELEDWLSASTGQSLFYYNSTWGVMTGFPASFNTDGEINDHHFHWGYFIMAAATVAWFDPAWAAEDAWGGMVNMLIRDANSWDRDDDMFPFLRYFDIYASHSWASGHGVFPWNNNQESSSEALQFAAATALWGSLTGNSTIRDLGVFLFTHEMIAVEQYWFDVDDTVFPDEFEQICVGQVWGTKGSHSTWFSSQPEMIHGINFLPMTAASLYLGRYPDYVQANYDEMVAENGGLEDDWVDLMWQYLALTDPQAALDKWNANPGYEPEGGESKAHTYYWLHSLRHMGQVDATVTADCAHYAVTIQDGLRTYTAFNPSFANPITVHFSDGYTMEVPAGELTTGQSTSIEDDPGDASHGQTQLYQAYPNPFNPTTTIHFTLARAGHVELSIFNLNGQRIKTLANKNLPAGTHRVTWDGFTESGSSAASGIYFYRMKTRAYDHAKRVVLMK